MTESRRRYLLSFEARRPNWLERIAYAVLTIGVIVVGFFFLAAALVAGALLALVAIARLWWLSRELERARRASRSAALEGEYEIVERPESRRTRTK